MDQEKVIELITEIEKGLLSAFGPPLNLTSLTKENITAFFDGLLSRGE